MLVELDTSLWSPAIDGGGGGVEEWNTEHAAKHKGLVGMEWWLGGRTDGRTEIGWRSHTTHSTYSRFQTFILCLLGSSCWLYGWRSGLLFRSPGLCHSMVILGHVREVQSGRPWRKTPSLTL